METKTKAAELTERDLRRVAAEALVDLRSARRAYENAAVLGLTRERLRVAAARLRLPPPPAGREA